jgi:hypothetical protein
MPHQVSDQSARATPKAERPSRHAAVAAWLAAVLLLLAGEYWGFGEKEFRFSFATPIDWLLAADADLLFYLGLLIAGPLIWRFHNRQPSAVSVSAGPKSGWLDRLIAPFAEQCRGSWARGVAFSALVASVSLATSAFVAGRIGNLPPAYHDEYSYLFQAKTFLAGRVSYPSHEGARLFDQMHVLNEGRFASRYFPGAGIWMAPFVAIGHPVYGHWLAGALCAAIFFWCGRELSGDGVGLLAGLLIALAPGQALFSNILVAHHPTLAGLSLFVYGFLRMTRGGGLLWPVACGAGLCFAALCRPMTAAGTALPFGIYLGYWALRSAPVDRAARLRQTVCLAIPLALGGCLMFLYNREITGSGWQTPYSAYTDIYTPRHVYGFNNVERGGRRAGPRVIDSYDRWASNLTPPLAIENLRRRWLASWTWTLGIVPLGISAVAGIACWSRLSAAARLILLSIISLHAVHVPYWFAGMENYHYVFESGVLWCLWCALATGEMLRVWQAEGRALISLWWIGLLAGSAVMNWSLSGGVWSAPLEQGIGRLLYPRQLYAQFARQVASRVQPGPALVLVNADPADVHINYVVNDPDLRGSVLFGRYLPDEVPIDDVRRIFPERRLFIYHAKEARFEEIGD